MKSMRMKMKAKKVSKVGKAWRVFAGLKERTSGGLKKADLTKSKSGKIVSKKRSAYGKKIYKNISKWNAAVSKARKSLGIKGFVPVGDKTAKGQAFLNAARSLYKK